jgi:uncharacterized protein YaeQ
VALKSTIFRAEVEVSDLDRGHFATHSLTIARHPSETDARMMVRLLAFALNADEALDFGRGLSAEEEPDLVRKDLTGAIELWIDVGLPDERDIRKASGRAREVKVYAYGSRSLTVWWAQNRDAFLKIRNASYYQVDDEACAALAKWAEKNMKFAVTIQEGAVYFSRGDDTLQLSAPQLA